MFVFFFFGSSLDVTVIMTYLDSEYMVGEGGSGLDFERGEYRCTIRTVDESI